jgi:hypothetical protein
MGTVINGGIVAEPDARKLIQYAKAQGWISA